ncbi:MAG: hypothetical protein AB1630_04330 [bacterium]
METLKEMYEKLREGEGYAIKNVAAELKMAPITFKSYVYKGVKPKDPEVLKRITRYFKKELSSLEKKKGELLAGKLTGKLTGVRKGLTSLFLEVGKGNTREAIKDIKKELSIPPTTFEHWYYEGLKPNEENLKRLAEYFTKKLKRPITPGCILGLEEIKKEEKPKVEEKPKPKVEIKAKPKPVEKPKPKVEIKAKPKVEEKPKPKVEIKAKPKPVEKPKPKVEIKAKPKVEEKPKPKVEIKAKPKPVEKPKPPIKAKPKVEEKPKPKVEIKAKPKPVEKPKPKVEIKAKPKVEEKSKEELKLKPEDIDSLIEGLKSLQSELKEKKEPPLSDEEKALIAKFRKLSSSEKQGLMMFLK